MFGARVADGLIRGDVITAHLVDYLAIPALIGLILMTIAKFGWAWAVNLDRGNKAWIILLVLSGIWVVFSFIWAFWSIV